MGQIVVAVSQICRRRVAVVHKVQDQSSSCELELEYIEGSKVPVTLHVLKNTPSSSYPSVTPPRGCANVLARKA